MDEKNLNELQEEAKTETETVESVPETESVVTEDVDSTQEASAVDAESESSEEDAQDKPKSRKEKIAFNLYDLASVVGTAVIAIMVVFTFFYRFVGVVGPSMMPTLMDGDWLAVSAVPKTPEAGDIIIITQPNAFNEPIVKRIIATEGQTVDIREGHVFVDGEMKVETYIAPDVYTEREDLDNYPLTVKKGEVFVLGDNRPHSSDSRSSYIGTINTNYILGTVSFRLMPFGNWKVGMEYNYN